MTKAPATTITNYIEATWTRYASLDCLFKGGIRFYYCYLTGNFKFSFKDKIVVSLRAHCFGKCNEVVANETVSERLE